MNSESATSTKQRASARLARVRLGMESPPKLASHHSLCSPLTAHNSHFHPRRDLSRPRREAHCNAKQRQGQGKGKFSCGGLTRKASGGGASGVILAAPGGVRRGRASKRHGRATSGAELPFLPLSCRRADQRLDCRVRDVFQVLIELLIHEKDHAAAGRILETEGRVR